MTRLKVFKDTILKKESRIVIGIFLLALGLRLVYLYGSSFNPSFQAPTVDSATYDTMARSVANGQPMNDNFFWQPFFYPAFLSIVYLISDSSIICAKFIQLLLGCITCVLTYRLGKMIFNRGIGIIAGVITAIYGPLIFFEAELLASGWAAFWSVVIILLFLKAPSEKGVWFCLLLGACGGLSIITRPTFLPFFAAACLWLTVVFLRSRDKWSRIAINLSGTLIGFLLIVIPVAVQNLRITGHLGIMPSSGGINFFVGNNPDYTETLTARPGWGWEEITIIPEQNGVIGDMWEQQRYFYKRVIEFVFTEPFEFVKGIIYKATQFVNSREIPRNTEIYLFGKWSRLLNMLAWKVNGFGFPFGAILPLILYGLIVYWRRVPIPLKLFLALYSLSVILVFVTARYRVPMIPVMSVVAAAGLWHFVRTIYTLDWRRILIFVFFGVVVFLFSTLPGPFPEEQVNFESELYANVASTEIEEGKIDAAVEHLNKSLSLQPGYPYAYANLGIAMAKMGDTEKAVTYYQTALEFKDNSPEVHNNLASGLAEMGEIEQAIAHYKTAIKIRPNYAEANYNLGNLLVREGKFDENTANYLRKAVLIKKDYFKAHNSLAIVLSKQGNYKEAVVHFSRAVELRPNDYNMRYNLAMAYTKSGKLEEAVKEYNELLRINPNSTEVMLELARMFLDDKGSSIYSTGKAIELAKKACDNTSYKYPEAVDILARAYAEEGRFAEATAITEKVLKTTQSWEKWAEYFRKELQYYKTKAEKHP